MNWDIVIDSRRMELINIRLVRIYLINNRDFTIGGNRDFAVISTAVVGRRYDIGFFIATD